MNPLGKYKLNIWFYLPFIVNEVKSSWKCQRADIPVILVTLLPMNGPIRIYQPFRQVNIQGAHIFTGQWQMTPKPNSHNINMCGKWKYFINISNWPSPRSWQSCADIQGSTVPFWYSSWSLINHTILPSASCIHHALMNPDWA